MKATTIEKTGKQAKAGQGVGCLCQLGAVAFLVQGGDPQTAGILFLAGFLLMIFHYISGWWDHG